MTLLAIIGLLALALVLAIVGGALAGIRIGGEHLGRELAAMVGAFYGPAAVLPAAIVGLIILALVQ